MDHNQIIRAAQSRRAVSELGRAIAHLSSDEFIELPLEERMAHAQGYKSRLEPLSMDLPRNPYTMSYFHLLRTILEVYE